MHHLESSPLRLAALLLLGLLPSCAPAETTWLLDPPQPAPGRAFTLTVTFDPVALDSLSHEGRVYHRFRLPGAGGQGEPGRPDLPALGRLLDLPDREGVRVEWLDGRCETLEGVQAWPLQPGGAAPAAAWLEDKACYATDAWWPAEPLQVGAPALLRDHRVAPLCLSPVQVNPARGLARCWTRLVLRVSFGVHDGRNAREHPLPRRSPGFEASHGALALNLAAPAQGALWELGEERPGRYLVFGREAVFQQPAMADYLTWKLRRGHPVTTVITAANATVDDIRNRIISEYFNEDPVEFVLLVGDVTGTYALPTHSTRYDHYYAQAAGDDIFADVAVGRISVETAFQLETVLRKIQRYESDPWLDDPAWLQRAGFTVGQNAGIPQMVEASRGIIDDLTTIRGYTDIDTLFDAHSSSHVIPWINAGLSFYNYVGWIGMEGLDMGAVGNLQQGPRTPVATLFTEQTGNFAGGTSYTEAFLRAGTPTTQGGAVAAVGYFTSSIHEPYTTAMAAGFYHGLLRHGLQDVGQCLFHAKTQHELNLPPGSGIANIYSYWCNLIGDPGTEMLAGAPAILAATSPDTLALGDNWLEIAVSSAGQPVAGATVCAFQPQDSTALQVVALSDAAGVARLVLPPLETGDLLLTITGDRLDPLLRTIPVATAAADPAPLQAWIDGGEILLPGRTGQALTFTLGNLGTAAMTNLWLTLALPPELGSVVMTPIPIAALAAGDTSPVLAGVLISPVPHLVDGQRVPVELQVACDQGQFRRVILLRVAAPVVTINEVQYPQGPLQPGTEGQLRLMLRNTGSLSAEDPLLTLSSDALQWITVPQPAQQVGYWPAGDTLSVTYAVQVSPAALPGQGLPLRLDWSSDSGERSGWSGLLPVAGAPQATDPTGPDAHGYWAYESTDVGYASAPPFDWLAVSPAEGGAGQWLDLVDDTQEGADATWVDLPFPFVYYGHSYTRAQVSSSGFLAFGAADWYLESYYHNMRLPGPVGPDALIAPLWDNFVIPSGGGAGVATWFDPERGRFVVSWVNLRFHNSNLVNSFQLILLDPSRYPTPSGDGEFVFQHLIFHDDSWGGEDIAYATIGLMDHTRTQGMTLRNAGVTEHPTLAPGMNWAGRAIRFTTQNDGALEPPRIELGSGALEMTLEQGQAGDDSLAVVNSGGSSLECSLSLSPPEWAGWSPGVLVVGPEATGWIHLHFDTHPGFELPLGDYHADLFIQTNDPAVPVARVTLTLHVTAVGVEDQDLPRETSLAAAWPNPFNPSVRIRLAVADAQPLSLTVYNLAGQVVARLLDQRSLPAGRHELVWQPSDAASGLYLLRLEQGPRHWQRKVTLLR